MNHQAVSPKTPGRRPKTPGPSKTPARASISDYSSRILASTYQPVPQTPVRPGALVYRDEGGITREIWQPGDGNGVKDSEFPNKPLFKERYRFFQSDIGPIERGTNSPPYYVALDDKAVWDVVSSKKYTAKERAAYWPLDFMANGVLRAPRRHKGRAARTANDAEGDGEEGDDQSAGRISWVKAGSKNNSMNYYLSGEPGGYTEAVFHSPSVRPGPSNHTATFTGGRKDVNQTKTLTTSAMSNPNNGSKTEYSIKRKAEQPLNPRHDRPKVGKYLHSTPSPEWPGGVRRLNKPPVTRARADDETQVDPLGGSDWSPSTKVGGKTVYARYDYGGEAPERVNGRLVASGARTSYARTPHADGSKIPFMDQGARTPHQAPTFEAKTPGPKAPGPTALTAPTDAPVLSYDTREALPGRPLPWEVVKRMGEELEQAKGILRMRDEEILNLKAQINMLARDKRRAYE
jgi:hypothetical protein